MCSVTSAEALSEAGLKVRHELIDQLKNHLKFSFNSLELDSEQGVINFY